MITWINCSERMPPDDEYEIILNDFGVSTWMNGVTCNRVTLSGKAKWTPYTEEAWRALNK